VHHKSIIYVYVSFWNSTVLTDLEIYTGFIPTQLMTNTSGCCYSLYCFWWWTQRASETCRAYL